ncbi:MAG TPA: hypothetical protein VGL53_31470 [Bryobacteraceae bacterium]|jgi:hypothetical protein
MIAAVLKEDPPALADSGKSAPAEIGRVIERCLAKSPSQRFHSAHDLAFALRTMSSASGQPLPVSTVNFADKRRRTPMLAGVAGGVVVVMAGAGFYWHNRPQNLVPDGSRPRHGCHRGSPPRCSSGSDIPGNEFVPAVVVVSGAPL